MQHFVRYRSSYQHVRFIVFMSRMFVDLFQEPGPEEYDLLFVCVLFSLPGSGLDKLGNNLVIVVG
jgi:hypothetical protein